MTILNYDNQGFIMGVGRMSKGIDNVHDDTHEIVRILKSQNQIGNTKLSELTRAVQSASQRLSAQSNINNNRRSQNSGSPNPILDSDTSPSRAHRRRANLRTRRAGRNPDAAPSPSQSPASDRNNRRPRLSRDSNNAGDRARARRSSTNPNGGSNNAPRERDANGRFTGGNQSAGQAAIARMMAGFKGMNGGGNIGGVDPVLDSIKEAKDLLSPLGRVAKLGGRAAKFSLSKLKGMKRREPLPIDQERHNNENEKLLDKIWKAIRKSDSGSGGGAGLLGGLLGGGRGRGRGRRGRGGLLGKIKNLGGRGLRAVGGIKGLGIASTIAGAASLGMDWKGLNKEEKVERVGQTAGGGIGAIVGGTIGSVVPVVGTAVGAVVGGYLGAKGGALIANTVEPRIDGWTTSLKSYNLAGKMDTFWKAGMTPVFSLFADLGRSTKSWLGDMFNRGKEMFGFGGGGDGTPADTAIKAADFAVQNAATISLGACAEYVNNAFQANGLQASGHGKDVANNLMALNKGKFESVDYNEGYAPQVGDVMSMPSSKKSKHNYGHVAIYTDQGWVSDYKQGEKYGNTAAPNSDYYEDIQSGRIKPSIARMINTDAPKGAAGGDKGKTAQAMQYFTSKGWTKQQAAGLTANLQKESQFDHTAVGDSGRAYGVAQWHPDRQANFKAKYGKSIKQASYAEQLAFVNHELTNGTEQAAGKRLRQAKTAGQAGAVVSQFYERPKNVEAEKRERAAIAATIDKNYSVTTSNANKAKPTSSATGFSLGNVKAASNIAPASLNSGGYGAAGFAPTPMLAIPSMPKITQRLDSGSSDKPLMVQTSNDTINQNVSDRDLAHAITGGLGQSRQWA